MAGVERVTWKPEDAASVREAVRGLDTLVYLVGVPYDRFDQHPVVMRQTLAGAIAEGVQRMVLVGTVYPYGLPRTTPVTEDHPREPNTFKGRMRKEQEDLLLEADAGGRSAGPSSGFPTSTARESRRASSTKTCSSLRSRAGPRT